MRGRPGRAAHRNGRQSAVRGLGWPGQGTVSAIHEPISADFVGSGGVGFDSLARQGIVTSPPYECVRVVTMSILPFNLYVGAGRDGAGREQIARRLIPRLAPPLWLYPRAPIRPGINWERRDGCANRSHDIRQGRDTPRNAKLTSQFNGLHGLASQNTCKLEVCRNFQFSPSPTPTRHTGRPSN